MTVSGCAGAGNGVDCENGASCSTEALVPCMNNASCCSVSGYSCNFVPQFGNVCCAKAGKFCSSSADCCSLSCNVNSQCD